MKITEVRIKLMDDADDRLQAFCSITIDDCFVVRDLKIIEGTNGPFVAMPSRKLTAHCPQCGCKNHLRAAYCNQCGSRLKDDIAIKDQEGRIKLYADIAHPINSECRELIQEHVISAFKQEWQMSKQPGYVSQYDEVYDYELSAGPGPGPEKDKPAHTDQPRIEAGNAGPQGPHVQPKKNVDHKGNRTEGNDFGAGVF